MKKASTKCLHSRKSKRRYCSSTIAPATHGFILGGSFANCSFTFNVSGNEQLFLTFLFFFFKNQKVKKYV